MVTRTLPIRVNPARGEALDSWLEKIAHRTRSSFSDVLDAVGLEPGNGGSGLQGVKILRDTEVKSLATATGARPDTIRAMTLARYNSIAVDIDEDSRTINRRTLWGRGTGSRFCPECLTANEGRWSLSWRLGWVYACLTHECLLADTCPECERVQRQRVHPGESVPHPGHCAQPATNTTGRLANRCDSDLTAATTLHLPPEHPTLAAQQSILTAIDDGTARFGVFAHRPVPTRTALSDIRAIALQALGYGSATLLVPSVPSDILDVHELNEAPLSSESRREAASDRPGFMAPPNAATAATAITAALSILGQNNINTAASAMSDIIILRRNDGRDVTPKTTSAWGRGTSSTLTAIQLTALAPDMRPSDQLRYRALTRSPARPVVDDERMNQLSRFTPTIFWPNLTVLIASPDRLFDAQRQALAAGIQLVGTRLTVSGAAARLGSSFNGHSLTRMIKMFGRRTDWAGLIAALSDLSDFITEHGVPIDYQRRRELDYSALLDNAQWAGICRETGTAPGSGMRHQIARAYLFELISGQSAAAAPSAHPRTPSDGFRLHLANFPAILTPALRDSLYDTALQFLIDNGITGEPITWRPPTEFLNAHTPQTQAIEHIDINRLHQLVRTGDNALSGVADNLGLTIDAVRYLLQEHPAPDPECGSQTGYRKAQTVLSEKELTTLYRDQNLSLRMIAERVGVSRQTIRRLARDYGIEAHPTGRPRTLVDPHWLFDQYATQCRTLPELAKEKGMSPTNLARWAKQYGIPLRNRGGGSHSRTLNAPNHADQAPKLLRPALQTPGGWERLLRFAEACQHATLTKAAQAMKIRQTVLTTQLDRLERELGTALLHRAQRGQPMKPTTFGRRVIKTIKHATSQTPTN